MKLIKTLILITVMTLVIALPAYAEVLEDNFNNYQTTGINPFPQDNEQSPVFVYDEYWTKTQQMGYVSITASGPDGSNALKMGRGSTISLPTKDLDISESDVVYAFSFDIRFSVLVDNIYIGGDAWSASKSMFKLNSDGKVMTTSDGSTYTDSGQTYSADEWLKVIIYAQGKNKYGYLIDSDGNVAKSSVLNYTTNDVTKISAVFLDSTTAGSTTTYLDNAKIVSYDTSADAPSYIESSMEVLTGVPRNQELKFTFDQKLAADSEAVLTKNGSPSSTVTVQTTVIEPNTVIVTYEGLLDKKAEYTLSFEGVTNGVLGSNDAITFETEDLHPWNDIVVSSAVTNGENTDITFTIGEEYNYPDFTGAVMAIVYEGEKMIKADMVALTAQAVGVVTKSFSLGTVPSGATITVILLDTNAHPIPLASGDLQN